jgi:cell division protein ZapA
MSDTQPTSVVVNIYGKTFTFSLGPDQTAEHVQQAAQLIDEKMREVHEAHHTQSPIQSAVLASLNMVDELFKLQANYQAAESDIAQRTSRLNASLGRAFQSTGLDSATSSTS